MNTTKTIGLIYRALQLVINNRNLLLGVVFSFMVSCYSTKEQKNLLLQYDNYSEKYVYTFVEEMPSYIGGDNAFLSDFSKCFQYSFSDSENMQTKFRFQFVINKKGHLVGARIYGKKAEELTNFDKKGLETLMSLQNWQAGKHNGKFVNVVLTKTIQVDY